jgi:hypothetical protein
MKKMWIVSIVMGLALALTIGCGSSDPKLRVWDGSCEEPVVEAEYEVWFPTDVRHDGVAAIVEAPSNDGDGALELSSIASQDKAELSYYWDPELYPERTLANLGALSFEFYRDASSDVSAALAPVVRLIVANEDGSMAYLIWEGAYNGYGGGVTEDVWIAEDLFEDYFWMYVIGVGGVWDFDVTLDDWLTGNYTPSGATPITIDADTLVVGINVGIGSGWNGTFLGYADNINAQWGDEDLLATNFRARCDYETPTWPGE